MYGKIFRQIYASTLAANWKAMVTFQQFIVLADADGVVDFPPEVIHRTTGIPLDIIEEGIVYLEKTDPQSRSPAEEGRRIVRLDEHRSWGWQIVNFQYYKNLASAEQVREGNRRRQKTFKERHKSNGSVTPDNANNATQTHTQTKRKEGRKNRASPPPENFEVTNELRQWGHSLALTDAFLDSETPKFLDYHRSKGSVFKDWNAAWRTWIRKAKEWGAKPVKPGAFDIEATARRLGMQAKPGESWEQFGQRVRRANDQPH